MQHVPQHLRELNPEQRDAALATEGPVLILAGAGSGKTRTLVFRINHLLHGGVDPRRILAVTFTNRAALEMRERVSKMAGKAAKGVVLSTFHSLGARILREHGKRIGLPEKFSIYGTGDQTSIIKRIMTEEVHVVATAGDEKYDVKQVLFQISDWKNRLVPPEEATREVAEGRVQGNRGDDYAVLAADVYPRYEQALRAAGAADFDDLLLLPVKLLREEQEVREALWRRWHYLMIDEYQDTNGAQLEMARLVAGPRQNLCVVGDDDQSIYAWRGADVRNILDFERHYPGARVVILEQNYRSTQRILDAANAVIANNATRKEKRLRTDNGPGPRLDYWEFQPDGVKSAEECEAEMVAREIGVRRFTEKLQWGDFAVLYRTNLQSRPLEEALRAATIPYRVIGGTSFFDRKEVADAAAYMRVVINPADEVSLRRVLGYQPGVGRTTLLRLAEEARASRRTMWDVLVTADRVDGINRPQDEAIRRFVEMMDAARAEWQTVESALESGAPGDLTLHDWVRGFIRSLRLEETVRKENSTSERAAEVRIEILRDFVASVARYEERVWSKQPLPDEEDDWSPPTLAGFLERISLNDEGDDKKDDKDEDPERVTLLTLHSAKGLEYAHVFLVGVEEEILPHSRSVQAVTDGSGIDWMAEERRLFYVGITRARHRLTLSGCAVRGGGRRKDRNPDKPARTDTVPEKPRQPSRFLKEIPEDLIEYRTPRQATSLTEDESKALKGNFFAQMREMLGSHDG